MVEFADKFYLIAYAMIFPVGVAAFIIAYKSQYDSGARGATLFGAPLLITFLALLPLFIFQELKNDPVFVWASCILLIVIIAIIIGAFRFQLGYLWANRKLITVILLILSIFSAAWSARSVELTVCLCAGDSNFFIKIVAVILGIIYTVTYVALYFYFLSSMVDRVERKPFKKSGIAFFGKRLSSRSAKTRGEVMYILGRVKEEWAWRLLIRQAINDEDAELREKALERVKKAGLPPEFLAAAGVAPQDMSRFADSQQPAAGTDTVPQQQQPAAGVGPLAAFYQKVAHRGLFGGDFRSGVLRVDKSYFDI